MNDDDQHTTNNEQSTDVPTDQQQYLTQLENRLSQLEDENKHLKSTVAVLQIHLAKYDKQMTQLQQDQRMIQDYIKSTIDRGKDIVATSPNGSTTATTTASQSNNNKTVAYFVLRANGTQTHTKPIESFLQSRFTHMTEYSHGSQYDLVFVIFYRSSGRLDHVTESTDLAMFKNLQNCWFICAHGSVWDDTCNYSEVITKYQIKGVLQFNVWDGLIQTKNSPTTLQAIRSIDEFVIPSYSFQNKKRLSTNKLKELITDHFWK